MLSEAGPALAIRPAGPADAALFARWDAAPQVRAAVSADGTHGFDADWPRELAGHAGLAYFVAELDGRPIGALALLDPARDPEGYWGEAEPGLRAIDIWIGEAGALGRGHGTAMMRWAIARAFAEPAVVAVVVDPLEANRGAHRFYARLGFRDAGRRRFGDGSDCRVFRLDRADWRG